MRFKKTRVERSNFEGTKQAQAILAAARQVFIRDGGTQFSARRVAKEANLSLGSVQHVFPTVESLLVAMLESVISEYDAGYVEMTTSLPFQPAARLEAVLDSLMTDVFRQPTRRFFFGFWSLSCHQPLVGALLKEAYAYHLSNLAAFIAAARPDLDDAGCTRTAMQVACLIEGSMLFTAPGTNALKRSDVELALRDGVRRLLAAGVTN